MKTKFIRVKDISEIDTSKVRVYDLNNRYIDREGNMYGLRYNRQTRKMDIIKIIRTPAKSAEYYQQILVNQKKLGIIGRDDEKIFESEDEIEGDLTLSNNSTIDIDAVELAFDPNSFIDTLVNLMQTHRERLSGIMMNIRNSSIISEDDRGNYKQLDDIFRNIDMDGIQRIEKVLAIHKEIKNYPRSISYYLSKLDGKGRRIINELDSDRSKMDYIYYSEMFYLIKNLYRTLFKMLKDLNYFIENNNPDDRVDLNYTEKKFYQDARISVDNTLSEIDWLLEDIKRLDNYLSDPTNFQ